ncbi:MAG: DNA translocase FtsK 4TM domain-containing protein [Pseudomonadota bacterium]|nr:DNA translocase FtsK 4TM domain-containing protein [Pseudomonadota bacterium]MDE3037607.1 DNA translocase FtsK 4TM domain-containing protein [Pseudomonadota bacterium]
MARTSTRSLPGDESRHPLVTLAGTGLFVLAAYLLLCLTTYNQADPSPDSITSNPVTNAGGHAGAWIADVTLQVLGLASGLLVLVPAAWGVKMLRGRRVPYLWLRFSLLIISLVLACSLLSLAEPPLSWPINSGLGGAIGRTLHDNLLYQPLKSSLFDAFLGAIMLVTASLAFGMSWSEWKTFGRGARHALFFVGGLAAVVIPRGRWRDGGDTEDDRTSWRARLKFWKGEEEEDEIEAPRREPRVSKKNGKPTEKLPRAAPKAQVSLPLSQGDYELPPIRLLHVMPKSRKNMLSETSLTQNAKLLETVLQDFGVNGTIVEIRPGPVVTLYELEPAAGTKTSRVIGLADDIARSMSAISARIAVIPGRNAIGVELPNSNRETVYLREMLESDTFDTDEAKLPLALGKDISGQPIIVDLARMPHLLVAGTTGSGKSVAINTMIMSLVYRLTPDECKFIMIDPKMLELSVYEGIPHLLAPVVTEPGKAVVALKWTVKEMENRYRLMSNLGVRNIEGYNKKIREAKSRGSQLMRTVQTGFNPDTGEPIIEEQPLEMVELPFIVVVVDEMADLMIVSGKEIESSIQRLAQMARAAGIHIIMATQRPSVDVITGVIKANFPTRISFQVTSRIDSRTILGDQGAEQLLGQGDMLYMAGGGRITRVHGPFVSDKEVEQVAGHLRAQGQPSYLEDVTRDEEEEGAFAEGGEKDAMYDQAVSIVTRDRKASTSYVQRCLRIGYNRAASIIDQMERDGIVGPANHVGKREVLVREDS